MVLFATIAVIGVEILSQVDLTNNRNLVIIAISLAMGIIPSNYPEFYKHIPFEGAQIVLGNGIIMGSLAAIVLNALFNHLRRSEEEVEAELTESALMASETRIGEDLHPPRLIVEVRG